MDNLGDEYCITDLYLCRDYEGDIKADDGEMQLAMFVPFESLQELQESQSKLFPPFAESLKYIDKSETALDDGNTGLPFGLCKSEGIELPDGATPEDAWEALKGKGITPENAYEEAGQKSEQAETPTEKPENLSSESAEKSTETVENSAEGGIIDLQQESLMQESFGKNVDKQVKGFKPFKTMLKTRFNSGTHEAKALFNKFVPTDSIAETDCLDTPHFSPNDKKVHLNIINDMNDSGRGAGSQFFHEHGHLVDYYAGGLSTSSPEFLNALKTDFESYLKKIEKESNVSRDRAAGFFEDELQYKRKHGVSDIIDGLSGGKIWGCATHSQTNSKYWKEQGKIEQEAFAHMFESCFDSEKSKYMAQYFPDAYKEFKKLMKGAV